MIVDVSIHNGAIDWKKVKESGVEGAIIRCGYGRDMTKQDDARFKANIEGAIAQGLRVGVYMYSYAKTEDSARSEAQHTLRLVDPYKQHITLPIYYDLEENNCAQYAKRNAEIFGDIIEKAGYWCGVYSSSYWFKTHLKGLNRFTKWVADWGVNDGKPHKKPTFDNTDLWQYTSKGKVNGIAGRVDCNELLNPNIKGYIGAKPATPAAPATPAPSKPETKPQPAPDPTPSKPSESSYMTYTIKKGDTLSKIARRFGTTVKAIQAANPNKIKNVNLIIAGDTIKIPTK